MMSGRLANGARRTALRFPTALLSKKTLLSKKLAPAAVLFAGALLAAPAGSAAAQDLKVWRHGIIEAKSDAGILYMASRRDFAAKLGLKLEFVQLKADTIALKALLAGELDSCEGGAGGTIAAASRGADAKIVGCHWLVPPHGLYVQPRIASIAELKGRSVAVSSPGSLPEIFARAAFEKAGIAAGQVRFASMGSDTERFKALMAGVVDGAVISNEYVPVAGQIGGQPAIRDLMPAAEVMPGFIRVCIEMTGKTLREKRPLAVRFMAAEIEGLRFAMGHREDTIRVAREVTGAKPDDPRPGFVFDAAVRMNAVATDLPLPEDKLDFLQKQLIASGALARPGDIAKMVDKELREEALALLAAGR